MANIDTIVTDRLAKTGTVIGVSGWITLDQTKIDAFAKTTLDPQFIHVDPGRAAAETPFGGTIAHGFLTLSMCSRFALDALPPIPDIKMSLNYGFDKIRFLNPVCSGDQVRGRIVLDKVAKRSETQMLQTYGLTVEIKDKETPAIVAQWLALALF